MPRETISHMGVFEIARMMAYGITRIRHIMSCHVIAFHIIYENYTSVLTNRIKLQTKLRHR
jgi:hypothetical protein